jgi:TonB family protein
LILPQRPDFLACLAEPDPPVTSTLKEAGESWTPKKTRHVDPRFPVNARREYAEGIVLLEIVVRPSGCVGEVRVVRGILPILDLEAINAVSGWRYEPRIIDGVAEAFLMTASVQFRLNQ